MDNLLGSKTIGQRLLKQVQRPEPQEEQAGAGAVLQPTGLTVGPIPWLPARKASFPNMVCSQPQGITSSQGVGHPVPLPQ